MQLKVKVYRGNIATKHSLELDCLACDDFDTGILNFMKQPGSAGWISFGKP